MIQAVPRLCDVRLKRSILLLSALFLLFYSCASPQVLKEEFKAYSEILQGDTAIISWNFLNADKVLIENHSGIYKSRDSIKVAPQFSRKYNILTVNGADTNLNIARVYVKSKTDSIPVDQSLIKRIPGISFSENEFFSGISNQNQAAPARLKIMKFNYPNKNDDIVSVHAIAMDNYGNFIKGLESDPWSLLQTCSTGGNEEKLGKINQINYLDNHNFIDIAVALDNSAPAEDNFISLQYINEFINSLQDRDYFSFSYFNHLINVPVPRDLVINAKNTVKSIKLPSPKGLSSVYQCAFVSIDKLRTVVDSNFKAVVIISFAPDNASIMINSSDISELSKKAGIPVYVISVGNAVDNYSLKNLSYITGGKYYHITLNEISKIDDILKEIAYSHFLYYEIKIPLALLNNNHNCDAFKNELVVNASASILSDEVHFDFNRNFECERCQALAIFNYKDTIVAQEYLPAIEMLSSILKENPEHKILLAGHSCSEGSYSDNSYLSNKRAQIVKDMLIKNGAKDYQVKTKGEANNKPLFYLQQSEWQQMYNRRVEVKWLDSSLQPYEIIASAAQTEDEAAQLVSSWEQRGYKSYFERQIKDNSPFYIIKLWGYSSEIEAKRVAESLNKKYNSVFMVE